MSATGTTIRPIDLDDLAPGVDEETSQAGSVCADSFDTKREEPPAATVGGRERETRQRVTLIVAPRALLCT